MGDRDRLKASYDRIAQAYARRFLHELDAKPLDRQVLDRFAGLVGNLGPICDLGCGPGHVTNYLASRGGEVLGMDISPEMVGLARELFPELIFRQGDMLALPVADGAWGGIAAFYSIIHLPREQIVTVLREFKRLLRPGGWLLLAFHLGEGVIHLDSWFDQPVDLYFHLLGRDEMAGYVRSAGFAIVDVDERPPYQEVEPPMRRCYVLARKLAPAQANAAPAEKESY